MAAANLPYLGHEDIVGLELSLGDVFLAVERAFVEHARGAVEMPPKIGVHPQPGTFLHAMPAFIPALGICGMKWVSGFPANAERGLPTIAGLLILNDPDTGLPYALLDAQWITAVRTAVVSALIVRCGVRPGARLLAVAGCGVQGQHHLRCLVHVLPEIERIRLFDVRADNAQRLRDQAAAYTRAVVEVVASPEACLRGVDVAATCTSGRLELAEDWLPPGGTAVGVDSFVAWGALFGKAKLIMDDERQARAFDRHGKYPGGLPPVHAELGELLVGTKIARENAGERILGLPLGLAIADLAVAQLAWQAYAGRR
jgi:ornithine cyclodeaminase/alanine dehydrogenase